MTKTLARELGPHGINVNSVAPGAVMTPGFLKSRPPDQIEGHMEARKKGNVLHRMGTPEDMANAVLFLASEESSFISGQILCVDGGRMDRL